MTNAARCFGNAARARLAGFTRLPQIRRGDGVNL